MTNVETRGTVDLCPMISVVGLTPAYFQNKGFQANYRQRITHHILLGRESGSRQYQAVASLSTHDAQVAFVAKYLQAVRAGVARLDEWSGGTEPIPNRCDECIYRMPCHSVFGTDEGVGLFPFTAQAIATLYTALEDPEHRSTYQTPRGMVQGVLSPILLRPATLDAGECPGVEIESALIPEDRRRIPTITAEVLEAQVPDSQREQFRRVVAYWGSGDSPFIGVTDDQGGEATFAGVSREIYEAFGLPWIGGAAPGTSAPERTIETGPPGSPLTTQEVKGTSQVPSLRPGRRETAPSPKPPTAKPISKSELVALQHEVARWIEGKALSNPHKLNRLAYEILNLLSWNHFGISPWIWKKLFTTDTVILADTQQARISHFVIPKEDWVRKGIEAYQALRTGTEGLDVLEIERYQRAFATMQRRLGNIASTHVRRRLPSLGDGSEWSIVSTLTQVLLARAWLRGTAHPTMPTWVQWRAVLAPEAEPTSAPQDRVDSWKEALNQTVNSHDKLRSVLQHMVNLPQGAREDELSLADASVASRAVATLSATFRLSPFPDRPANTGQQLAELDLLAASAKAVDQRLHDIPKYEVERLRRLAETVSRLARNHSVRQHILRITSITDGVAKSLPAATAAAIQEWQATRTKLAAQGYLSEGLTGPNAEVEAFIDRVLDGDVPDAENLAAALAWALEAPASALRVVSDAFGVAEKTVQGLLAYVEVFLESSPTAGGSLDDIHRAGRRISEAVEKALKGLEDDRNTARAVG